MMRSKHLYSIIILGIFLLSSGNQLHSLFQSSDNKKGTTNGITSNGNYQIVPQNIRNTGGNSKQQNTANNALISGIEQKNPNDQGLNGKNSIGTKASINSISGNVVQGVNDSLWYNNDWKYRKNITILPNAFSANENNFPLLIDIYDSGLKLALNSGNDILFTDAQNNKLPHEIEMFNKSYSPTQAHLRVWVKGNYSSTVNTTLMMYFGNPFSANQQNAPAVWSNGYAAVYHLDGNPSQTLIDSSGQYNATGYTGTNVMSSTNSVTGEIGNAVSFNGVNERILVNNIISSGTWSAITLEAWINPNSLTSSTDIVGKEASSGSPVTWDMYLSKKQVNFLFSTDANGGSVATSANAIGSTGSWYQLASTWNASTSQANIFVNGVSKTSGTVAGNYIYDGSPYSSMIGGSPDGSSYLFNGLIDEVRISNVSRSSNWLSDEYNNILNPSSFYTVSPSVDALHLKLNWSINQLDYRKEIKINHNNTNQTLNNYVFPIHLIDSDLHAHAQANGGDIIFTDVNGTRLDFQIESYNNNYDSTHSELMAWVKIPTISNITDTSIFMYYGNSTVVHPNFGSKLWKSYSAVWHLSEVVTDEQNVSYAYVDSTGNGNYGNQTGSSTQNAVLGRGQYFDGNDKITIKSSSMPTGSNGIITGWFNLHSPFTSSNTTSEVILSKYSSTTNNAHLALAGTDYGNMSVPRGALVFKDEQTQQVFTWTNQTSWLANKWYQFTIIFNKNNPANNKIYINGTDDTNSTTSCTSCTIGLNFAGSWTFGGGTVDTEIPGGQAYFIGSLDEIRIENSVPTNNEILFTYKSEVNDSAYFVQNQYVFDYTPPTLLNFGVDDSGTGVATYWASFYDKAGVKSAFIEINNSAHGLTYNGSLWVYVTNPTFNDYYNYSMVNATDIQGNFGAIINSTKYITFNIDKQAPDVYSWTYNPNDGNNGTFYAEVVDNWGMVNSVEVLIVTAPLKMPNPNYAFMTKINNTFYSTGSIYMVGQTISFKIFANDTSGNNITTSTHSATVNNRAPTVSNPILESGSGTQYFSNLTLTLTYTYSDPENDTNQSQIYWYKNGALQTLYTNSLGIPSDVLIKNDNWTAVIEAYDGHQFGNNISVYAIILNSAPNVTATLNTVDSSTALTPVYTYSDSDNDIMKGFTIIWYKNGTEVPALYNSTTVDPSYTTRGDEWNYTIQVFDGQAYSQIVASNTITITNSAPIATNVGFNSTSVSNTDTVNITYSYFDNDNDPQNISMRKVYWFVNGVYNSTLDNVTILFPFNRTNNAFYYYIVTVSDGYIGANYTSIGISIGSITNSYPPSASGLTIELTTSGLSCVTNNCTALDSIKIYYVYSDPDSNPEFGTKIAWFLNSTGSFVLQSQYNDTLILPVGALRKGEEWIAMVTPSDGKFYGTPVNSSIITIKDIKPVVTPNTSKISVLSSSGSYTAVLFTYTDQTLYPSWQATDGDNDTITAYQIYWFNGTNEIAWNENYLPSNFTRKGENWYFIVKVFDGQLWSDNSSLYGISIVNTAPQVINTALSGGDNTSTALTVSYTFVDPDNDPDLTQITWYVNSVQVGGSTLTLSSSYFKAGDLVYAKLTPNDNQTNGNQVITITIQIGDSAPQIANSGAPEIVIYGNNNNTNIYANSTLFVYFNATDLDGTGGNYGLYPLTAGYYITDVGAQYRWYKNGLLQTNLISNTVPSQYLKKGDYWTVSVRTIDKYGDYSPWTNISSSIVILNSAPVVQSISWVTQHPTSQTNVQISIAKYDIDSDTIQTKIRWFVNDSGVITEIFSNENNTVLQSTNYIKNDRVFVMVTLSDGYNIGLSVNSSQILIGNSLPVVTSIVFNNGKDTYTNDSLTVSWGYNDPDNDPQNKSMVYIEWYINGIKNSSFTNLTTINSAYTLKGEVWSVHIQVFDGQNYSIIYDSQSFTFFVIKNSPPEVLSISINNNQITFTNDSLVLNYTYYDINHDLEVKSAIIVMWYKNGVLIPAYGNLTSIPSSLSNKNDVFRVEIRVFDGSIYSLVYSSQNLTIANFVPQVKSITWLNPYPTSQQDVNISVNILDYDNDTQHIIIRWFVNKSGVITEITSYENKTYLDYSFYVKSDYVFVMVESFDGTNYSLAVNSSSVLILNTPPIVTSISINNGQDTFTYQNLTVNWSYSDFDGDSQVNSSVKILWFKNGILQTTFTNHIIIDSTNTNTKTGDIWNVTIQVYDGYNYSKIYFTVITIKNSLPVASSVSINYNQITYTDNNLEATYIYSDPDGDQQITQKLIIFWFKNGNPIPQLSNQTIVPSSYTSRGDNFTFEIRVFDGYNYSIIYTSLILEISNKPPTSINYFVFPTNDINSTSTRNFFLTTENITIYYQFIDADGDPSNSSIYWFKNGIKQDLFTNKTQIPNTYLMNGDKWQYEIILSDGIVTENGVFSNTVYIEEGPTISNSVISPTNSSSANEGIFDVAIKTNNSINQVTQVDIILDQNIQSDNSIKSLISNQSVKLYTIQSANNKTWIYDHLDLFSNNRELFKSLMGKTIIFTIKVYSNVIDPITKSQFQVFNIYYLTVKLVDKSPPRVDSVTINTDTLGKITFYVNIVDYGSGIKNATIYYYFEEMNNNSTVSSNSNQNLKLFAFNKNIELPNGYKIAELTAINSTFYTVTVPFEANSSVNILYQISVFDNDNNANLNAYPLGLTPSKDNQFILQSKLPIEMIAGIIGLIVLFAFIFTFVGIRKFRKTEIVGLDIERVMEEVPSFRDSDIQPDLTRHTLGIIISIFHQSLGPMPIFAIPSILTDNLEKLIDLSDISFSTVRFVENFDTEKQTYFDYNISSSISVTSLSYGFSLNRPEARGGSENITLNILLHKPYDTIIGQFTEKIDPFIHEIHVTLDKEEGEREAIEKMVQDLRNFVTKIILSFERMYPDQAIEDLIEF